MQHFTLGEIEADITRVSGGYLVRRF